MPQTDIPELVRLAEAAERISMDPRTARLLAAKGRLPGAVMLGARWYVDPLVFREALNRETPRQPEPAGRQRIE